jgi:hypothetical protein
VTVAVIVQLIPAARLAPLTVITLPPVTAIVPPHCGEVAVAVNAPAPGRVSVKPMPVRATLPSAVLSIVNVSVAVCPTPMVCGLAPNDLVRMGRGCTTKVSVAVMPVSATGPVADTVPVVLT